MTPPSGSAESRFELDMDALEELQGWLRLPAQQFHARLGELMREGREATSTTRQQAIRAATEALEALYRRLSTDGRRHDGRRE